MAEREQKRRTTSRTEDDEVAPEAQPKIGLQAHHDAVVADIDDLLDEIDEVLETNAEDFVRSYIQKGGE